VQGKLPITFVANTGIDEEMGTPLIEDQQKFFAGLADQIELTTRTTKKDFLADLQNANLAAQLIYLYCHAESYVPGEGVRTQDSTIIIEGNTTATGLSVKELNVRAPTRTKLNSAPLVFINACQGAELSAQLYAGLMPYLVQKGCRGVIGTEVNTPALFAAEFAQRFFTRFLKGDTTLGQLMLDLRREFAQKHKNLMGLVYATYSNGEVRVAK